MVMKFAKKNFDVSMKNEDASDSVRSAKAIGLDQSSAFTQERLITRSKSLTTFTRTDYRHFVRNTEEKLQRQKKA